VTALASAAAARRREMRTCSAAAYRAQQQRQWCEGGFTASKDVLWAQSVIDAAVGKAPCSTGGAAGGSVAGGGLPPSARADSAFSGNVCTLCKLVLPCVFFMLLLLFDRAWRDTCIRLVSCPVLD
jgi:hypothetical protein